MKIQPRQLALTTGALAAFVGASVFLPAQERRGDTPARPGQATNQGQERLNQNRRNRARPQQDRTRQNRTQQDRTRQDRMQSNQTRQSPGTAMLKPTGFIRIAADYDGDGQYDAVETIYAMDYVAARDASRQRMDSMNRRPRSVNGELTNLKKIELSGYGGPHMVGRVETDRGTVAKVDFGPAAQVESLGMTEGDRVDVEGRRGRINDKAMLLATKISSDGKTVQVDRPEPTGLRRVKGEITGLRNVKFRGHDDESVIADMRLVSGREVTANLGSKMKLTPLNLKQGGEVSLIARPGAINDEPALIASRVYADGQAVYVDARGDRERKNMDRTRN